MAKGIGQGSAQVRLVFDQEYFHGQLSPHYKEQRNTPMKRIFPLVAAANPGKRSPRLNWLDQWRGGAVIAMVGFHLAFDGQWWGWWELRGWWWRVSGWLILATFLLVAGVAARLNPVPNQPVRRARWWRQTWILTGTAVAITGVTYLVEPGYLVVWGVIHTLASWRWLAWWQQRVQVPGVMLVGLLGWWAWVWRQQPTPWWLVPLGLGQPQLTSFDYVPWWPWVLVYLAGWWLVAVVQRFSPAALTDYRLATSWLGRSCAWCGRHSLAIYVLHQPLLWVSFALLEWWRA